MEISEISPKLIDIVNTKSIFDVEFYCLDNINYLLAQGFTLDKDGFHRSWKLEPTTNNDETWAYTIEITANKIIYTSEIDSRMKGTVKLNISGDKKDFTTKYNEVVQKLKSDGAI